MSEEKTFERLVQDAWNIIVDLRVKARQQADIGYDVDEAVPDVREAEDTEKVCQVWMDTMHEIRRQHEKNIHELKVQV